MESTSSPKNSIRIGFSIPGAKTSTSPPRTATSPCISTKSLRSKPLVVKVVTNSSNFKISPRRTSRRFCESAAGCGTGKMRACAGAIIQARSMATSSVSAPVTPTSWVLSCSASSANFLSLSAYQSTESSPIRVSRSERMASAVSSSGAMTTICPGECFHVSAATTDFKLPMAFLTVMPWEVFSLSCAASALKEGESSRALKID